MATIKELKRMCMEHTNCVICPLYDGCDVKFPIANLPDDADEIVDKWTEEHSVKTYIDDFISKFPHIDDLDSDFKDTLYSYYCRKHLYGGDFECKNNCEKCWNEEMEE